MEYFYQRAEAKILLGVLGITSMDQSYSIMFCLKVTAESPQVKSPKPSQDWVAKRIFMTVDR